LGLEDDLSFKLPLNPTNIRSPFPVVSSSLLFSSLLFSAVIEVLGRGAIMMLALLVAKGWTITYSTVDDSAKLVA
jgi:hypothetical protein